MGVKKRWLFAILAWILALSLLPGCAGEKTAPAPTEPPMATPIPPSIPPVEPTPVDEVTLGEAEGIVGAPVTPKYLPPGYKSQRAFVRYWGSPPQADLSLFFSDEEMTGEVKTLQDFASLRYKIVLNVYQETKMPPPGFPERAAELYGGKVVDINGRKGWLATGPGGSQLIWDQPGLLFQMYAKGLSEGELVQVAESIK